MSINAKKTTDKKGNQMSELIIKGVVFTDIARIESLGGVLSFVRIKGETRLFTYPSKVFRFVVMPDGTLAIAPVLESHGVVYMLYKAWEEGIKTAEIYRNKVIYWEPGDPELVIGAGNIGVEGIVSQWYASTLQITTPKELRQPIQDEIVRLIKSGELDPTCQSIV